MRGICTCSPHFLKWYHMETHTVLVTMVKSRLNSITTVSSQKNKQTTTTKRKNKSQTRQFQCDLKQTFSLIWVVDLKSASTDKKCEAPTQQYKIKNYLFFLFILFHFSKSALQMHFVTFVMFYTCTLTPCYHGNGNASHTGLHHTHTRRWFGFRFGSFSCREGLHGGKEDI